MEFSLAANNQPPANNQLDSYINYPVTLLSQSVTTINGYDKLDIYFKTEKERTNKKLYQLEQRLEECLHGHSELQRSVEMTYSRVLQDKKQINLERYEDLLHYAFKQIQWTRSSRVSMDGVSEKKKSIVKHQQLLQQLQDQIKQRESDHKEMICTLKQNILKQFQNITDSCELKQQSLSHSLAQLETQLTQIDQLLQTTIAQLQIQQSTSTSTLTTRILQKMTQLQQQLSDPSTQNKPNTL